VARGVRNTVGFDWHPVTKELWFTDNGATGPATADRRQLNRIPKDMEGASFGFPYCHAMGIPDSGRERPNPVRRRDPAGGADRTAPPRASASSSTPANVPNIQDVAYIARHGSEPQRRKFGYDVAIRQNLRPKPRSSRPDRAS